MRNLIFVCALVMFLLTASMAAAQEFTMNVTPTERTVGIRQVAPFQIALASDLPEEEGFYLFLTGNPVFWVNVDTSYVEMPAHTSRNLKLYFFPNDIPGTYEYEVFFQLVRDPDRILSQKVTLTVLDVAQEGIFMTGDEITRDDDSVNFKLVLSSDIEEEVTVDYSLVSDSGFTVATDTRTYMVEGEKTITHSIPILPSMVAGTYTAKAWLKGAGIESQSSFGVEPVHRIVKTEAETSTPFFHEVRITIANEGNVVEKDYIIQSQVPTGFLTFSVEPAACEDEECEWTLAKLNPEESTQIIYRIQYWPLIAEGLVIAGLIASFVFIGWNKANKPTLNKKLGDRNGDDYTTVIEIKNAGKKIKNVVIRDQVSSLFEVKGKFETVKPAIRQTEEGTELVWTLGAIEPRDHRIIHYNVRPMVNGSLRLPKAYMTYESSGGKRAKISTKEKLMAA